MQIEYLCIFPYIPDPASEIYSIFPFEMTNICSSRAAAPVPSITRT